MLSLVLLSVLAEMISLKLSMCKMTNLEYLCRAKLPDILGHCSGLRFFSLERNYISLIFNIDSILIDLLPTIS